MALKTALMWLCQCHIQNDLRGLCGIYQWISEKLVIRNSVMMLSLIAVTPRYCEIAEIGLFR